MGKVVISASHAGFGLSAAAYKLYEEYAGRRFDQNEDWEIERDDAILVRVVEELGDAANYNSGRLEIEEVPSGTEYTIYEHDGAECVRPIDSFDWYIAK